jgi:hypothetical protein
VPDYNVLKTHITNFEHTPRAKLIKNLEHTPRAKLIKNWNIHQEQN